MMVTLTYPIHNSQVVSEWAQEGPFSSIEDAINAARELPEFGYGEIHYGYTQHSKSESEIIVTEIEYISGIISIYKQIEYNPKTRISETVIVFGKYSD